jgi:uncharacterized protein (TIGR02646 family)
VRHIAKGQEPRTVTETRCASTTDLSRPASARNAFDQLDKNAVRAQLAEEQGWLCAFCMRRIDENAVVQGEHIMKVAHRIPIAVDATGALNWRNLLGSCDGGQRHEGAPARCDCAQGSKALTVDPTQQGSVQRLDYERRETKEGLFITSDDSVLRSDLEETLALNAGDLPVLREAAWKAFLTSFTRRGPKASYGRQAWRAYFPSWLRANSVRGRLPPFLGVVEKKL